MEAQATTELGEHPPIVSRRTKLPWFRSWDRAFEWDYGEE